MLSVCYLFQVAHNNLVHAQKPLGCLQGVDEGGVSSVASRGGMHAAE